MLDKNIINDVLLAAVSTGGDFAELFIEDTFRNSMSYIGGQLESTQSGRDFGIGIRIFKGTNAIYAYTNSFKKEDLILTALKAASAISGIKTDLHFNLTNHEIDNIHSYEILPETVDKKDKLDIMKLAYDSAYNYSDVISQVSIGLQDQNQKIAIANTDGLYAEDQRVYCRITINSVAEKNGEMQTGGQRPGCLAGFEFIKNLDIKELAEHASQTAVTMVNAGYVDSGTYPVIIDNGFGGVIFHEACGHGLEATSVAKGTSVFAGKLGQQVASELVTAVDDSTMKNEWGSSNIDDEGSKTQRKVLIENGILKGYMIDRLNGMRMNMPSNGASRRQSYRFAPTSRMSNTFIVNGNSTLDEIIQSTESGVYAKQMGGGSVNPATGDFNFAVLEGYMIKNGKIDKPVRGATLIGKGDKILHKIDMVADNLAMDQGMCGSKSGSIPANVGQPAIRVASITVGGR
ncbi:MAG: TldD/PmbA family protein [Clostridia bacterium]|nr:TldD/PmbA family protein [Clostridia bacterium]